MSNYKPTTKPIGAHEVPVYYRFKAGDKCWTQGKWNYEVTVLKYTSEGKYLVKDIDDGFEFEIGASKLIPTK